MVLKTLKSLEILPLLYLSHLRAMAYLMLQLSLFYHLSWIRVLHWPPGILGTLLQRHQFSKTMAIDAKWSNKEEMWG